MFAVLRQNRLNSITGRNSLKSAPFALPIKLMGSMRESMRVFARGGSIICLDKLDQIVALPLPSRDRRLHGIFPDLRAAPAGPLRPAPSISSVSVAIKGSSSRSPFSITGIHHQSFGDVHIDIQMPSIAKMPTGLPGVYWPNHPASAQTIASKPNFRTGGQGKSQPAPTRKSAHCAWDCAYKPWPRIQSA